MAVKAPPEGVKPPRPQKTRANERGEFAFYVPPLRAEYVVTARARGFAAEQRTAVLSGGPERVDLYLTLRPAAKKEK